MSELIKRLRVENETQQNDSFLYINNSLRFLFINADVSLEDKCALLRHELGHISDPNFINTDASYSRIKREEFANEFSYYIKNPDICLKIYVFLRRKWELLVFLMALIACILGGSFLINTKTIPYEKPVIGDVSTSKPSNNVCYVTKGGEKYHRNFCIIVKYRTNLKEFTINEAVDAGHKPCLICISEE